LFRPTGNATHSADLEQSRTQRVTRLPSTRLDTAAMNLFLAELGQAVTLGAHGNVLMDKAGWHTASDLVIPANLSPVFLPPYSPELNPIAAMAASQRQSPLALRFPDHWRDPRHRL
jgi:DDE superfamily endonuclease